MTKALQFNNTQISNLDQLCKGDRLVFGGETYTLEDIQDDTFVFGLASANETAERAKLFTASEVMDFIKARMMQRMIPSVIEFSTTIVNTRRCCN